MPAAKLSRPELIRKLAEVFRQHGYAGASLERITAATGLGKGSLYNYFPGGKQAMAECVLEEIDAWFEREIYAPLRQAPDWRGDMQAPDWRGGVDAMLAATDAYFQSGGRICLMGAFALDDTRDLFAERLRGYFAAWIEALAGLLARGGLAAPQAKAESLVAGIQGALTLARALNDTTAFPRLLRKLRDDLT